MNLIKTQLSGAHGGESVERHFPDRHGATAAAARLLRRSWCDCDGYNCMELWINEQRVSNAVIDEMILRDNGTHRAEGLGAAIYDLYNATARPGAANLYDVFDLEEPPEEYV